MYHPIASNPIIIIFSFNQYTYIMRDLSNQPHDSSYTCHTCDVKDRCLFAFDPYNRDGDCLAVK